MAQNLAQAPAAELRAKQLHILREEEKAEEEVELRFEIGEKEENALLERVAAMVIRDKLALPTGITFEVDPESRFLKLVYEGHDDKRYGIHRHALSQLAAKVGMPLIYVNNLNTQNESELWRMKLLAHSFNELFHKNPWSFEPGTGKPIRFLHRLVGTELRGFLSRRFNRHLASAPLLRSFVEASRAATARPIEATASDVRLSLKCYLPHVYQPYPGQFICVGVEWSNSDFGAGRLQVAQTLWDPLRKTSSVLDEAIGRVHLGSIIEDSDIEMSDETAAAEVDAQAKAIRDAVVSMLSDRAVGRLLEGIRVANEQEIAWTKLKGQFAKFLYKKDIENIESILNGEEAVIDLPPPGRNAAGEPIPTKWWANAVVSTMAARTQDQDRKLELQREAGRFLAGLVGKEEA